MFSKCSFFFLTIDLLRKSWVKFWKEFGNSKTLHEVDDILEQSISFLSHSQESWVFLEKTTRKSGFDWRWSKLTYIYFWYFRVNLSSEFCCFCFLYQKIYITLTHKYKIVYLNLSIISNSKFKFKFEFKLEALTNTILIKP